jgi:hypothetical protein
MSQYPPGFWLGLLLSYLCWHHSAHADVLIYTLPGSDIQIVLEGKTERLAGGYVDYTHPTFGHLNFSSETVQVIDYPTKNEQFKRMFDKAKKNKDIDQFLEAAAFALQRGLLNEFYKTASEAYKIDSKHPTIIRLVEARKHIKAKLDAPDEVIASMKDLVARKGMEIEVSNHYVLMHDTSPEKIGKKKETRAKQRLDLLERVYECYMLKFALEGKVLPPPAKHMMVLLFAQERDYLHYVNLLDPNLQNALGFWDSKSNLAVFFDQGTTESMRALQSLARDLQIEKKRVSNSAVDNRTAGRFAQMSNTIEALSKIAAVERDIEVVSHEATHQLAGNTGLMPKGKLALTWAHEGLASYFETPEGGGWGGIGSVNKRRLRWYRVLADEHEIANVEFIVSDKIFDLASTHEAKVAAYGQAWALTHFLMEHHFDKLMTYYDRISELEVAEGAEGIERKLLVDIFKKSFGDTKSMDVEWRAYMRTLKPDVELAIEKKMRKDNR